jgi:nitrate/nitrite transport system substrate-binding protein
MNAMVTVSSPGTNSGFTVRSQYSSMKPLHRRQFLRLAVGAPAGLIAAKTLAACSTNPSSGSTNSGPAVAPSGANRAESDAPIKIGFIALTDCASVVMAHELGYFAERGLNVEVIKQASWPATRDNLLNGTIDAAHGLFSLPISLAAGIGGKPDQVIKIAMILNNNGQAITLASSMAGAGYGDLRRAEAAFNGKSDISLAMTFPGGTHDTWLRYWMKAAGLSAEQIKVIPIPPAQMVANMKVGTMAGFCVGEPWGAQAVKENIGFTHINTQDIWSQHPEKALIVNEEFSSKREGDLKAVMGAVLQASKWLDDPSNRSKAAKAIGVPGYVGAAPEVIEDRMLGKYGLGSNLGTKTYDEDRMRFFREGETNALRSSYVYWFLAQYQRFGLIKEAPDYKAIADRLLMKDLYKQVAESEGVAVPDDDMSPFRVKLDDVEFDPAKVEEEAARV